MMKGRWRPAVPARVVGLNLHDRLRASLGDNTVELRIFDTHAARYKENQFDIRALVLQVYLHFDPATHLARRTSGQSGSPLARQRMDFLILFSSRRRVVLEVDGKQHYAKGRPHAPTWTARWSRRIVDSDSRVRRCIGAAVRS